MKIKKLVIPATLALSMAFSFVPAMTFPATTAVAEASAYQAPATTAVKLAKGEVTVYDFGSIKLHSYKTNDVLSDECYVFEGQDGLVLLESTAFKENVQELNNYMKSLKKPLQGMFLSYHSNGYNTYPAVPIYATEKALASWKENGGVAALTNNFVQAFGDTVDANLPAKATIVKDGDTVKVAGIDFKILPTPDEDYSVEIPAIGVVYRHMLGSKVHNILPSIAYIDAEIADMEKYQQEGYGLILTSHYVPEGQEAVKEKLRYLRKVKELAGQSKDKADFIRQVKANFPTYEGDNYLEMSASALFK